MQDIARYSYVFFKYSTKNVSSEVYNEISQPSDNDQKNEQWGGGGNKTRSWTNETHLLGTTGYVLLVAVTLVLPR
jgi:hypothetical protein